MSVEKYHLRHFFCNCMNSKYWGIVEAQAKISQSSLGGSPQSPQEALESNRKP